jgi:hypothetical protein
MNAHAKHGSKRPAGSAEARYQDAFYHYGIDLHSQALNPALLSGLVCNFL